MAALNERDAVVFVHPGVHPTNKLHRAAVAGLHDGIPVRHHARGGESRVRRRARALSRASAYILPHAGGLVPYFSWRLSVSPMIDPRLPQLTQDERVRAAQALLVRQRAVARRADLGLPAARRGAGPDRVRQRLAVRQRAGDRRGAANLRGARRNLARRNAPRSIAATRCGCSRGSAEPRAMESTTRTPGRTFAIGLGLTALVTPLAVHLYFPMIPVVKAAFGLSDGLAYLTFSIALFGMAFATLVYGSVSDRHGRRRTLLWGLALFIVGSVIAAAAQTRDHAGGRTAGAGGRRRLRAGADARHRARCLQRRPPDQGHRLSYDVRHARPDGVAVRRRRADRQLRLAQRVRLCGVSGCIIIVVAYRALYETHPLARRTPSDVERAAKLRRAVPPVALQRVRAAERLRHRHVHGDGECCGLADDRAAAPPGHRIWPVLPAVSDRLLSRQPDLEPDRQPGVDRDHGADRLRSGARHRRWRRPGRCGRAS